jgi:GH25 family lysozyme M1 (1,4-beta-N-acetylmuramidase)
MAAIINESIFAGETLYFEVTVTDIDGVTPFDLWPAEIDFNLKQKAGESPVVAKDETSGISKVDENVYSFSLDASETEDLEGWYHMESCVTDNQGRSYVVFTGALHVRL